MTDFLDPNGCVPESPRPPRLIGYLGSIVAAVTTEPSRWSRELPMKCRRRPNRKPCPGTIRAGFEPATRNIIWACLLCSDNGVMHHWQNTPWDKGGRIGLPRIGRVTYRRGMLTDLTDASGIESVVLKGAAVSRDIVVALHDNELLGASGEYGNLLLGDPIQYDQLIIEHAQGETDIVLYNRAIMLFTSADEIYKRVHRVCCMIENAACPA